MKKILLSLIFSFSLQPLMAQAPTCVTEPLSPAGFRDLKEKSYRENRITDPRQRNVLRNISLNINILVYDNGPITTVEKVQQQIDTVNVQFAAAGMEFSICHVNYIVDGSPLPFWDINYEFQLGAIYDLPGCLNIYYVNYVVNASAYAYYPTLSSPDRIVMGQNLSGEILAHELGHSFYLLHTHGPYGTVSGTDELVNGSNCTVAGDIICDTPADPNLFFNRVDTLCNYADTVTTDTLGFLYAPDTRNIMSYSLFKCYQHLSTGQHNRMANILAHERAYLKSGGNLVSSITAPASMCIYDSAVQVTASPSGGTFSGNGISGSMFDPAAAGPGIHMITYTPPGTATIVETTDQYFQYSDTSIMTSLAWQSFPAGMNENLLGFSFYLKNTNAQDVYVSVYDSTGVSGNLIHTDTLVLAVDSFFNWNRLELSVAVHLDAGSVYTISLSPASFPLEVAAIKGNYYPPGIGNLATDLSFITHVMPDSPFCSNETVTVIRVSDPPETVVENFFPVFCISSPPRYISVNPGGGNISLNGITDSILNPAILGPGTHTLHYSYTDNLGCSNDSTFSFTVNDTTNIIGLPTTACTNDPAINFTGVPAGGLFYIDNTPLPLPQIDPQSMSPGSYMISYVHDSEYPWIDTLDQQNIPPNFNAYYSMGNNQNAWQSFTPGIKGYLNRIELNYYLGDSVPVVYRIFEGEGTAGSVIFEDTVIRGGNSTNDPSFLFPPLQLLLEKDSIYTFEWRMLMYANNTLAYSDSNHYTGGMSNFSNTFLEADFAFETHINAVFQCGPDSVVRTIVISPAPTVNLGNDTSVSAGQIIMLNAGITGVSYLWSTGDTTQIISYNGQTGSNHIWVIVTDVNGCSSTDTIVVNVIAGIRDVSGSEISVYPNPVNDMLYIETTEKTARTRIFNSLGEIVYDVLSARGPGMHEVSCKDLPEGFYMVKVTTSHRSYSARFIKATE